jgi:hypothetical protein
MPSSSDIVCPKSLQNQDDILYAYRNGDKYIFESSSEFEDKLPNSSPSWVCTVIEESKTKKYKQLPDLFVVDLLDMFGFPANITR